MILIAGDFNTKIGKYQMIMNVQENPQLEKGITPGRELLDFCGINELFISNRSFDHPVRHMSLPKKDSQ